MHRTSVLLRSLLTLVSLLLLVPSAALAVEQTGSVRGKVVDDAGEAIEGALVTATSPDLQGKQEAVVGKRGDFWLTGLPPGTYEIRATADGYETWVTRDLRINIGSTLTLNIDLSEAGVDESVTIVDERPAIDTTSSTTGQVITREYLQALPTRRSYQSAARLAPGVTGGSNPNAMGGSSRENKWLLDGANTSDPVTGTFSFNFNIDAIREVEVITGAFRAEDGNALGAIFNVVTESGSNELHGKAQVFYSNGNWSPKRDAVFVPDGGQVEGSEFDRDRQSLNVNASIGGPLLKDKLWFFTSLAYIRTTSTSLGARSPRVFDGFNVFGKITANVIPRNRFTLSVTNSPSNISNLSQSFLTDPEAQRHQHQNSLVITGEWNWFITNNVKAQVLYSHMKSDVDVTPQPCTWREDDRFNQCTEGQSEGYIDFITPGVLGRVGSRSRENYPFYSFNDRWRDSVRAKVTAYIPSPIGTHQVKVGGELGWLQADITAGATGNIYYVDRLEQTDDPSSAINWYWVERPGALRQTNKGFAAFAFLQDTWEPVPGLTIDIGLKYNNSTLRNDIGDKIVDFNTVAPVGGIAWDPTGKGKAKIYAGGGILFDESRLGISSFLDKNGSGFKLYLGEFFDGRTTNYAFDQWSSSNGQSNYSKFDQLTSPRIYAFATGFEVNLGAATIVSVNGQAKMFRNLWEDDEVNYIWNGNGTNSIGVINGLQENFFRLRTPTNASRNWFGITFQLQRMMFKNLLLDINYTLSMTRGITSTQITAALDNPTQLPYEYGWLYADRPHVIKAAAAYQLPYGFMLGGTFNFTSGSRFDRQYYSEKGGGYQNFVAEIGTFDSVNPWWSLDLKLQYKLKLPYGRLLTSVELNNVTNNRQATGISTGSLNATGEYFASGRQPPMNLELGLGYEW